MTNPELNLLHSAALYERGYKLLVAHYPLAEKLAKRGFLRVEQREYKGKGAHLRRDTSFRKAFITEAGKAELIIAEWL